MCGIAGIAFRDPRRPAEASLLVAMARSMVHRGPDDEGLAEFRGAGLAVRRLKVIDPGGSPQPVSNEDGSVHVIVNGEIYNYRELRAELASRGHRFKTDGDGEVIAHLYEDFGENCIDHLRGMFAVAIWDDEAKRLLLARDRLGQKPLHYARNDDRLVFGSEIKALLVDPDIEARLDPIAADRYFTFEYSPGTRTMFEGIERLAPGHLLVWHEGQVSTRAYWELKPRPQPGASVPELVDGLGERLRESVRLRLRSDVPLGVLLSGGLDSSTLVATMRELGETSIQTFSIGFDDKSYDETSYAREVARHFETDHHELVVKPDAAGLVSTLIDHCDEPFADTSAIATLLVARLAADHVTVALAGDGADELFAGYDPYLADRIAAVYSKLPRGLRRGIIEPLASQLPPTASKKGLLNRTKRFLEGTRHPEALGHVRWMTFLGQDDKRQLYSHGFKAALGEVSGHETILAARARFDGLGSVDQALATDLVTYLPDDILYKVDRTSMAASLEVRAPFLDHPLVEYVAGISSDSKLRRGRGKWILREAMKARLPPRILGRGKQGFSIPMKNWLRADLREMMRDVLSPARLAKTGLVDPTVVAQWMDQHERGAANHAHRLWPLMVFELWHGRYIVGAANVR